MVTRKSAFTTLLALVLGSVLSVPLHATSNILRTNTLTFSRPVALPGVTLPGGSYIFERAVDTNADVVVVRSSYRTRVFYMGMTQRVLRPAGLGPGRMVTLGEPQRGAPAPITAWYPDGETLGHAFVYGAR